MLGNRLSDKTPVRFITGEKDGLVTPKRVNQFIKEYGGSLPLSCQLDKGLIQSQASHVETREDHVILQAFDFLKKGFVNHIVHVKKIDAYFWDMKKYRRFKPCKWPQKKIKTSTKKTRDNGRLERNLPNSATGSRKASANLLEPQKDQDPSSVSGLRRSTRINPVHAQAFFNDVIIDNDYNYQQSTKSSDEIKSHKGIVQTTVINNGHPDDIMGLYSRGSPDLPYDPREARLQNSKDSGYNLRTNRPEIEGQRSDSQSKRYEPNPSQGLRAQDLYRPASTSQKSQNLQDRDVNIRPLQLRENSQIGHLTPQAKQSGFGLGGFAAEGSQWQNPQNYKRSDTNYDPSTSHLQHFGNPEYHRQKSAVVNFGQTESPPLPKPSGIQFKPQPSISGHNFFAQPGHPITKQELKKKAPMFDDDDLSVFLDQRYQLLGKKEIQLNGTLNLDDSMIQDLNTLNVLLKAKPR